ncbi:MAG TPA: aspartyl protease family protein [Steroidobacteraceae bacterium]|nr:aspartyl protease family protein [Steroidobacteraceae bacterium]
MATYTKTVTYEDYRDRGGIPVASTITAEDGVDADRDVIHVENVVLAKSASDFVRPQPIDDFSIAGGKTTIPIEFDGDVIVEAKLNGQGPFAFILDTGGHDIITPEVSTLLHLKPVGAGASGGSGEGTMPLQFAQVDRLEIGDATLKDQSFTVIPLPVDTTERGARPPLAGILGLELFERLAIRLDYGKKTLSLQSLSGYKHDGAGTAVPLFFTDDQPLFDGKIANVPGQIALDTGNSGTLIVQGVWADGNGLQRQMMSGFPSLGYGMGGASQSWSSRVDFEVAGSRFRGVIGHYSKDQKGAFSSRTEAGNVGNDVLANFALEFDYAHAQVWFEPAPGHDPWVFDRAGLSFFKDNADAFKISAVAAGTPAAEAGLRTNDVIAAVDGKPASQVSGWDLRRSMRAPPGTKVTLSLIRNGQPLSVVVILRELLPAAS